MFVNETVNDFRLLPEMYRNEQLSFLLTIPNYRQHLPECNIYIYIYIYIMVVFKIILGDQKCDWGLQTWVLGLAVMTTVKDLV